MEHVKGDLLVERKPTGIKITMCHICGFMQRSRVQPLQHIAECIGMLHACNLLQRKYNQQHVWPTCTGIADLTDFFGLSWKGELVCFLQCKPIQVQHTLHCLSRTDAQSWGCCCKDSNLRLDSFGLQLYHLLTLGESVFMNGKKSQTCKWQWCHLLVVNLQCSTHTTQWCLLQLMNNPPHQLTPVRLNQTTVMKAVDWGCMIHLRNTTWKKKVVLMSETGSGLAMFLFLWG